MAIQRLLYRFLYYEIYGDQTLTDSHLPAIYTAAIHTSDYLPNNVIYNRTLFVNTSILLDHSDVAQIQDGSVT